MKWLSNFGLAIPELRHRSNLGHKGRLVFLAACLGLPYFAACAEPGYVGVQAVGLTRWNDADIKTLAAEMRLQSRGDNVEVSVLPFTYEPSVTKVQRKLDTLVKHTFASKDSRGKTTQFRGSHFRLTLHLWFDHGTTVPPVPKREPYKEYYWDPSARPKAKAQPMRSRFKWSVFDKIVVSANGVHNVVPDEQAGLDADEQKFVSELRRRAQAVQDWRLSISAWLGTNRIQQFTLVVCPELEDTHNATAVGRYNRCLFWLSQVFSDDGSVPIEFRRSIALGDSLRPNFGGVGIAMERHGRFSEVVESSVDGDIYSNDGCGVNIRAKTVPEIKADEGSLKCGDGLESNMDSEDFLTDITTYCNPATGPHISFLVWRFAYNANPEHRVKWSITTGQPQRNFYPRNRKNLNPLLNPHRLVEATGADGSGKVETAFVRRILNEAKPARK